MKSHKLKTFIDFVAVAAIFLLVQYFGIRWLLYPELNYDEGYYIMGANRILEGDWFLQNHSFDKPFLHPLLIAISATLFGTQYLGYRMLGWALFSASFWIFGSALSRLFRQSSAFFWGAKIETVKVIEAKTAEDIDWSFYLLKWSLLVGLFVNPLMISNGASSMGEPFLLFLLTLILYYYPLDLAKTKGFLNNMGIAFWIKGSILIWLPLIWVLITRKTIKEILVCWKKMLWPLALISSVGLWFGLIGKTKLFVFRYLLDVLFSTEGSLKQDRSYASQFLGWLDIIRNSLGTGFIILLVFLLSIAVYILYCEKRRWREARSDTSYFNFWISRHLLAIAACIVLFFAIVTFTKVGLMPRYLISISPLIFYSAGLVLVLIFQRQSNWKTDALILLIAGLAVNLPFQVTDWLPPKFHGLAKISPSIFSELPQDSTLINKIVWPIAAYVPNDLQVIEVPYDVRLNRHQSRFNFEPSVFAFSDNSLYEGFQYYSKEFVQYCPEIQAVSKPSDILTMDDFKSLFLKSILATGKLEWVEMNWVNRPPIPATEFLNSFPFVFRESHAGVEFKATLKGTDLVMGSYPTIDIKGVFVLYHGRSLTRIWHSNGWALGLRMEQFQWREQSLDLLPGLLILKQGLTWPIFPIKTTSMNRPWKIEIHTTPAGRTLDVMQIKYLDSCSAKPFDPK